MGLFSPDVLPPARMPQNVQMFWAKVYNVALDYWVSYLPDYHDEDARLTANAAVYGWWEKQNGSWSRRRLAGLRRLPDVGNLFNCGTFIDVTTVDSSANVIVDQFGKGDKVSLYWSQDLRACVITPYLRVSACIYAPTSRENKISKIWAKGRPARCSRIFDTIHPPMPRQLPGLAIAYWSDKFAGRRGEMTHYIHHFENGVYAYFARPLPGHTAPAAIFVRGGKLRLTEHGLAG